MLNRCDAEFIAQTRSRAESYAFFARLLRQELSAEPLCQLRKMRNGAHDAVAAGEGLTLLDRYFSSRESLSDEQVLSELASDYAGLFLNAGSNPVHPYESVYTSPERLLMQQAWAQVRQIYAAAGLARAADLCESEDHIALEMAFMNHLCSCAAEACETGNAEAVRAHLMSQREFLEDHLLQWAPRFSEDLKRNASTDFYRALGFLIRDFFDLEREVITVWGAC